MEIDKSLDEIAAEKRKANPKPPRKPKAPAAQRNVSSNAGRRQAPTPYARPVPRSTEDRWTHDAYSGPRAHPTAHTRANPLVAGSAAVAFTGVSPRIEVTGLHYEVTPDDLRTIFSQAGTIVTGPHIRYDRSGRSRGEATIEYETPAQAKLAINKFDGAKTKGQTISIRLAPPARTAPSPGALAPSSAQSLLARIQGAPGAAPVSKVGIAAGGSRGVPMPNAGGPLRGGAGRGAGAAGRGAAAGAGGRGRGGAAGTGRAGGAGVAGGRAKGEKKGPKTEVDLDKELDSFMNKDTAGDVEMA